MSETAQFTLDDGTTVAIVAPGPDGSYPVGIGERLQPPLNTLRAALDPVTKGAMEIMDEFRNMARKPEEVEIKFGVTLDGKLGGLFTSASAGAHLDITLRWSESRTAASGGD